MSHDKNNKHQNQNCPLCNTPQLDPHEPNCAICGFDFSLAVLEDNQADTTQPKERQAFDFLLDEIHLINVLSSL
jgi:ribosomal protein L37E